MVDPVEKRSWLDAIAQRSRLVVMCTLALLVVFVVTLAPFAVSALRASTAARERWGPARFQALTLLASFVDQETGERGYIITRDVTYLEPYTKGRAAAPRLLRQLERELPVVEDRLVRSVRTDYASWLAAVGREIAAVRANDARAATNLVDSGVGKERFDALRERQARLITAVDALLAKALRTSQRANQAFVAALVVLLTLGTVVVGVSWRRLRRSLAEGTYSYDLERLQSDEQHRFVEALQVAVLPELPAHGVGLQVASRYLPARTTFEIGGDWYDVFPLTGGRVGLVVGDVVGRGLRAAAVMSQLRSALHAIALRCEEPGDVFDRLDEFARNYPNALCTTAFYAIYDAGEHALFVCNAGHPPPLLMQPGARPRLLDDALRTPIGVRPPGGPSPTARVNLQGTARLVMYTDGLVERRGESLDVGLARLERACEEQLHTSPDALADRLIESLVGADRSDDTALLIVDLAATGHAPPPG